jgi:hypothetical protein
MAGQLVARCDTALSSQHPQTGPCPGYPRLGMAATSYAGSTRVTRPLKR